MQVTTSGIDVAKHVFQLQGVDARGYTVLTQPVKRSQLRFTTDHPANTVTVVSILREGLLSVENPAGAHET